MARQKMVSWTSLIPSCYKSRSQSKPKRRVMGKEPGSPFSMELDLCNSPHNNNLYIFTLAELRTITHNFSQKNFLGEGENGRVHKGFIIHDNMIPGLKSQRVVVKHLDLNGMQGHKEWLTKVTHIGQLKHPNLVKLIGYCYEEEHRRLLLVYEYMTQGSLENQLFRHGYTPRLPWATRMKIALGAAKGLVFLHEAKPAMIYGYFKASNILLDVDYTAKLSDFGLEKDSNRVCLRGYPAPEYAKTGRSTTMSDVFSFGVVLLEILTGKQTRDNNRPEKERNLVVWARPYLNDPKKLNRLIDPRLDGQYSFKEAQKVAQLACQCLNENPKSRPSMSHVVTLLQLMQNCNDIPVGPSIYTVVQTPPKVKTEPQTGKVKLEHEPEKANAGHELEKNEDGKKGKKDNKEIIEEDKDEEDEEEK